MYFTMVKLFESFGVLRALFSFKNKTPCSTQASRTPSQPGWDRELVYYSCPIPSPALLSERWAAQNPTMALCNNILCIWSRYLRKEVSVLPNCLHSSLAPISMYSMYHLYLPIFNCNPLQYAIFTLSSSVQFNKISLNMHYALNTVK